MNQHSSKKMEPQVEACMMMSNSFLIEGYPNRGTRGAAVPCQ